jgi:hypothetical protein
MESISSKEGPSRCSMFQKSEALPAKDTTGGVGKTQMAIPDTLAIVPEWRATPKLWARTDFRRRGLEVRMKEARSRQGLLVLSSPRTLFLDANSQQSELISLTCWAHASR